MGKQGTVEELAVLEARVQPETQVHLITLFLAD
jgi:hypothetical protein